MKKITLKWSQMTMEMRKDVLRFYQEKGKDEGKKVYEHDLNASSYPILEGKFSPHKDF